MTPIKKRDTAQSTRYPGVKRLGQGRYLIRKTWVDPRTGRRSQKSKIVKGALEEAVEARANLQPTPSATKRTRPRFKSYAAAWLTRHARKKGIAGSTRDRYTNDTARLISYFGPWWVDAIDVDALDEWQDDESRRGAPATVNSYLRTLRLILDRAVHDGHLTSNPARALATLPEKRTEGARGRSLSPDQFRGFLRALERLGELGAEAERQRAAARAEGKHGPRGWGNGIAPDLTRAVVALSWTGARIGEVIALRWDDIAEGEIRIERSVWRGKEKATKTDDPRRLTLSEPLARVLEEQRQWLLATQHPGLGSGLVFPSSPGQAKAGGARRKGELGWYRSQSAIRSAVAAACDAARVPRITPHSLRRTFADLLREAGVADLVRKALAGWRTDKAQGIYETVRRNERDDATAAVVELVFAKEATNA